MTPEQQARRDDAAYKRLERFLENTVERMEHQGRKGKSGDEPFRSAVYRITTHWDRLGRVDRRRLLTMLIADAMAYRLVRRQMAVDEDGKSVGEA